MSAASDRGEKFEHRVEKITRKTLRLDVKRDSRSGAGLHKQDVRDRFGELPIHIECKDQEKLNVKSDWRIANSKAVVGQAPIVVFPDGNEVLCVMRYSDHLQQIRESMDWQAAYEELRAAQSAAAAKAILQQDGSHRTTRTSKQSPKSEQNTNKLCPNGHIADEWGYCIAKGCKYQRGFKVSKKGK